MYVSVDEACTHVAASSFRLVAGIYELPPQLPAAGPASGAPAEAPACKHGRLLGTAVSPPIK